MDNKSSKSFNKKAQSNVSEAWKAQWAKFMFNFYDYLPVKYSATEREWAVRKLIWDFKEGKRSLKVAEIVADTLRKQFGKDISKVTSVCIPASSAGRTEIRYKAFAEEVSRLSGCKNGYKGIKIEGERMAVHETNTGKQVQPVEVITLNKRFFAGKKVVVFDDVLTRGHSYTFFACELEKAGAEVLDGYFLAKTIFRNN